MKKAKYGLWIFIVIVLVALILIYFLRSSENGNSEKEKLAKCLNEKGAVLYVNIGCPHCENQKTDFGEAVEFLNIIECAEEPEECKYLLGVPSWKINGVIKSGKQSLKKLTELSGCEY